MRAASIAATLAALVAGPAAASICHTFVRDVPGVAYAQLGPTPADGAAESVTVEYVTHSTYRITTDAGVVIATDYFGAHGAGRLPDIVTMNHAHSTHYTDYPDPGIPHVLRGWNPAGDGPAEHMLEVDDVVVRNVTTDIRDWSGGREADGNSIFVFETAGLCLAHLGHLHHTLSDAHVNMLGRMDVVMAPVDGTYTLDIGGMIEVLDRLKASIVLPMHAFGPTTMRRFLDGMAESYRIERRDEAALEVSLTSLPPTPTVVLLSGHRFRFSD